MQLARRKRAWPTFVLPLDRGAMTVFEVIAEPAGTERDVAIHDWSVSVWEAFATNRDAMVEFLRPYGLV